MTHSQRFLELTSQTAMVIDHAAVEKIASAMVQLRERQGRLFLFGAGGSAANCSHATNDFRKLSRSTRSVQPTMWPS